jgi:uncharacterized membrane protein
MTQRRDQPPAPYELDANDRALAALGYIIVIVAIVVALVDETKRKPLLMDHAKQAIGFAVASFAYQMVAGIFYVCMTIISFGLLGLVLWVVFLVPFVIGLYLAYVAYNQDRLVEIPYLTQFMAEQGWFETRPAT